MKNILTRIILVFSFIFISTSHAFSQRIQFGSGAYENCNIDGYWGEWLPLSDVYGNYSSFVVYTLQPYNFHFKFTINGVHNPTKKQIKLRYKKDIWWEYTGTVEYYVNEEYPTIKEVFKRWGRPFYNPNLSFPGEPVVKRTAKAIIKIAPYKKRPKVYNFFFDDVGYAIDLGSLYFDN